jgi:hypothetical protein
VLFDVDDAALRLVATDRHRLAVTALPVTGVAGPPVRVIVPVAVVDAFLDGAETMRVGVSLAAGHVTLGDLDGAPIDAIYPDYGALLAAHGSRSGETRPRPSVTTGVTVTAPDLLERVMRDETRSGSRARPHDELVMIGLDPTKVHVGDAPQAIAFDRKYLADAVRSFGDADLRLTVGERDAIRLAAVDGPDAVVLLMPVRPHASAA